MTRRNGWYDPPKATPTTLQRTIFGFALSLQQARNTTGRLTARSPRRVIRALARYAH